MSTLKVTNIQHPNAVDPAIELDPVDGVVFSAASFDASAITSGVLDEARLPAVGGLVAVKHVLKTDTFVASSVAAGANVAVDDLTITHEVADDDNRLIITAYFGAAGNSDGRAQVGIAINEFTPGGTPEDVLIGVGAAEGSRTPVGAGGRPLPTADTQNIQAPSITFVHTPGAGAKTYSVRAINVRSATRDLYINRAELDADGEDRPRAASALVIQEVKV